MSDQVRGKNIEWPRESSWPTTCRIGRVETGGAETLLTGPPKRAESAASWAWGKKMDAGKAKGGELSSNWYFADHRRKETLPGKAFDIIRGMEKTHI